MRLVKQRRSRGVSRLCASRPIERLESRTLLAAVGDDTLAGAIPVDGLGGFAGKQTFNGSVGITDQVDYYRIDAPQIFPNKFTARLYNLGANLDLSLIQDRNNNGVEDPGELVASSSHTGTTEESLGNSLAPTGPYYIKVRSVIPANSGYSLDLVNDSTGDTPDTARFLDNNARQSVSEGLNNTDDLFDVYQFVFGHSFGDTGTVAVKLVSSNAINYHVDLYRDTNGNRVLDPSELITSSHPGDGDQEIAPRSLTVDEHDNTYYLRVLHGSLSTDNYTLNVLFDYAGSTLATAREDGGNQDFLPMYVDEVGDTPGVDFFDKDDFYHFVESNPVTFYAELDLSAQTPASGHKATFQLINDANANGKVDAGETLATATTDATGKAFLKRPLTPGTHYYIHVTGTPFPTYTLTLNGDTVPGITKATPQTTNAKDRGTLDGQIEQDGSLGAGDETDSFKFVLPLAGSISGTFDNRANSQGIVSIAKDGNNNGKIDSNETLATFDRAHPLAKKSFAAGTYFMTVSGTVTHEYDVVLTPDFAGDTPQTARSLGTLGAFTQVKDGVGGPNPGDLDFYKFSLSAAQMFTATLDQHGFGNNTATTLALFKDNGGGSLTQLQTASVTGQFGMLQRSLAAGNYQLKISHTPGFSNYSLGFSTGDNDDAMAEVLLSQHNAAEVAPDFGFEGDYTLSDAADVDLLAVFVNRGATVTFDTSSRDGSNVNTFLRLFDSTGKQIASNDDGAAPGEASSKFSFLKFTVPGNSNGTYFLGISSAGNINYSPSTGGGDAGGSSTGAYHLSIRDITGLTAQIAGAVFNDANGNGKQDAGETAVADRTVYIDLDNDNKLDSNEFRTTTNTAGQYTLPNLGAGTFKVREVVPTGFSQTSPTSSGPINVTLTSGQKVTGKNFFTRQTNGSIAGTVFHDFNRNKIKDLGDSGLGAWTVYIDTNGNNVFDSGKDISAKTDASGNFTFGNLAAGTYKVRIVLMKDFVQTVPASNGSSSVTLTAGQKKTGLLFGADN